MDSEANELFFTQMGRRMARYRSEAGLTQKDLGEQIGLKQQLVAAYEKGTRRIPASLLEPICQSLGIHVDELLGIEVEESKRRGPAPFVQKKVEQIQQLPLSQRKSLLDTIDNYLKANL